MKISLNSGYLVQRYGYEKAFAVMKEAGFDAADVTLGGMCQDPESPFIKDGYREYAQQIRAAADAVGLEINQTHAPFQYKQKQWDDPEYYQNVIIPNLIRSIEISGILGAEIEVVHPLHHFVYYGHEEEIFEKNMAYYKELIPYAEKANVKIAVENMFQADPRRKFLVADTCSSTEEFIRYVDTLNSPYIVACLDVGHIGLTQRPDEAWDVARALGHDRLQSLHIHDNDYRGDQHRIPYYGTINWVEVTRALGEIDYQGVFTYEVGGLLPAMDDEFLPVGVKYLADIAKHMTDMIDRNRPAK